MASTKLSNFLTVPAHLTEVALSVTVPKAGGASVTQQDKARDAGGRGVRVTQPTKRKPCAAFQLFLKTLTGHTETCTVKPRYTVARLKELIQERTGTPVDPQRLVYAGNQLEDNHTLADYKVEAESTVHTLLRLAGC